MNASRASSSSLSAAAAAFGLSSSSSLQSSSLPFFPFFPLSFFFFCEAAVDGLLASEASEASADAATDCSAAEALSSSCRAGDKSLSAAKARRKELPRICAAKRCRGAHVVAVASFSLPLLILLFAATSNLGVGSLRRGAQAKREGSEAINAVQSTR